MRRASHRNSSAVSEILGVTMLLAMVVTVIGGVFVLLGPFVNDINDNREWSASSVAATQLNDRILIVGQSPEGTGVTHHNPELAQSIDSLRDVETWTVQADLGGFDRTTVTVDGNLVNVTSINRTAYLVMLTSDSVSENWILTNGSGNRTLSNYTSGVVTVDVEDIHGVLIHRYVSVPLDGIRLNNQMTDGHFSIDLVNGARIEELPGLGIDVRQFPRLNHDVLLDGTLRVSLVLIDIDIAQSASRHASTIHLDSKGEETLFDTSARNLVVEFDIAGNPTIAPQYIHHWTGDHSLYMASGTMDDYVGFGPHGRISGLDGMTMLPTETIELHVSIQTVEVS